MADWLTGRPSAIAWSELRLPARSHGLKDRGRGRRGGELAPNPQILVPRRSISSPSRIVTSTPNRFESCFSSAVRSRAPAEDDFPVTASAEEGHTQRTCRKTQTPHSAAISTMSAASSRKRRRSGNTKTPSLGSEEPLIGPRVRLPSSAFEDESSGEDEELFDSDDGPGDIPEDSDSSDDDQLISDSSSDSDKDLPVPLRYAAAKTKEERRAVRRQRRRELSGLKDAPISEPIVKDDISDSSQESGEDSDDTGGVRARIGEVPLEWYDEEDHVGYDVRGEKVPHGKKSTRDAIDAFLSRTDPKNKFTIYDPYNGEYVTLSPEEVNMLHRIRKGKYASRKFDDELHLGDYYTSVLHVESLGNAQEPKRRFVPSKWEEKRVLKYIHAIRNGWLKLEKEPPPRETWLLWSEDGQADVPERRRAPPSIPAPKLPPPGHVESYNPPEEYLPTPEELAEWEEMDPEDRPHNFIPTRFTRLLDVPAYEEFVRERFERCLDLYLAARKQVRKLNIDPKSLLPELPKPSELQPFPTRLALEYRGHTGKIRSISVSPCGQWIVSGSDDGFVRVWEVDTGRCVQIHSLVKWLHKMAPESSFDDDHGEDEDDDSDVEGEAAKSAQKSSIPKDMQKRKLPKAAVDVRYTAVDCVAWNPTPHLPLIAATVGKNTVLFHAQTGSYKLTAAVENLFIKSSELRAAQQEEAVTAHATKGKLATWKLHRRVEIYREAGLSFDELGEDPLTLAESKKPRASEEEGEEEEEEEVEEELGTRVSRITLQFERRCRQVVWHHKGDYFATYTPERASKSVLVHRLSQNHSMAPFGKSKGLVQSVLFHNSKPQLFVATKRHIRIFDLVQETLVKKLQCPAKWISCMSLHPTGDHLLVGSYDRRVCWYDLHLSSKPYKTFKYHNRAVRAVAYHDRYPLFASAADSGKVQIFHAQVYADLITDPQLVPVQSLNAHIPQGELGALACQFHPTQPWVFTAGVDQAVRLWT